VSGQPPHSVVGTLEITEFLLHSVHAEGSVLFATAGDGIYGIDISNPVAPTLLGHLGTGLPGMDLALCGSFAYVSVRAAGLQVYGISDPSDPAWVGGIAPPEHAWGVAIDDEIVVVSDGITYDGNTLQILPRHCRAAGVGELGVASHRPVPWVSQNPVRTVTDVSYLVGRTATLKLTAYDVQGSCQRTLMTSGSQRAGLHSVTWDVTDDVGNRLSPGVYWVKLDTAGEVATRRVVVVD
jgi:hypothetical protein